MQKILFALVISSLILTSLYAKNESKVKHNPRIQLEMGFTSTSGNTDTTTYNMDLKMKKKWDLHTLSFLFDTLVSDEDGKKTKNKYLAELQYDYEIREKFYFNYLTGYKDDRFSGYNYQLYTGPGIAYKTIPKERHFILFEGNILHSEDSIKESNYVHKYTSLRGKATYKWLILDSLKFYQDVSYRFELENRDNYFINSSTSLKTKNIDIFKIGITYKIDFVNMPPSGVKNTDKTLLLSLTVDY